MKSKKVPMQLGVVLDGRIVRKRQTRVTKRTIGHSLRSFSSHQHGCDAIRRSPLRNWRDLCLRRSVTLGGPAPLFRLPGRKSELQAPLSWRRYKRIGWIRGFRLGQQRVSVHCRRSTTGMLARYKKGNDLLEIQR